ncbi:hypothetical protein K474DRAFT_1712300 [Panus rudis PR-1116 ss-1]|nr:hypothetical protein K474DRAFT_1712300 [Panus rudis PR-1116 ss-1]
MLAYLFHGHQIIRLAKGLTPYQCLPDYDNVLMTGKVPNMLRAYAPEVVFGAKDKLIIGALCVDWEECWYGVDYSMAKQVHSKGQYTSRPGAFQLWPEGGEALILSFLKENLPRDNVYRHVALDVPEVIRALFKNTVKKPAPVASKAESSKVAKSAQRGRLDSKKIAAVVEDLSDVEENQANIAQALTSARALPKKAGNTGKTADQEHAHRSKAAQGSMSARPFVFIPPTQAHGRNAPTGRGLGVDHICLDSPALETTAPIPAPASVVHLNEPAPLSSVRLESSRQPAAESDEDEEPADNSSADEDFVPTTDSSGTSEGQTQSYSELAASVLTLQEDIREASAAVTKVGDALEARMDAMESAVNDLQCRALWYDDLLHEDTIQRHKLKERLKTQEQQLQVNLDAVLSYKARQQEQQLLIEQLFDTVQTMEAPGGPVSPPKSTPPLELSHTEPMQADATRLSESVQPDLTLGGPTNTDSTTVDPTGMDPTSMDPTGMDPTGVDPTGVDPTSMDWTTPDPTTPGLNSSGPTGADPSGGETVTGERDVSSCD